MLVEELYLQQTFVVLRGTQVEDYLQFFRSRNLTLDAGIVEGVTVRERQPAVAQRYGGIDG